jgi:dihydrofolate reductase
MIRHIVSLDASRGIAKGGTYPWHLPGDMEYFKRQTLSYGGVVLMGSKTYKTIGHPLTGRDNVVASRQSEVIPGVTVISDVARFLATQTTDVWVIGGSELYEQTMPMANELYVTEIAANYDCDVFYPDYQHDFILKSKSIVYEEDSVSYVHCIYERAH